MTSKMTTRKGAPSRPDPILGAIERHRRADAAYEAALAGRREDEIARAMQAERGTFWGLVENSPTTLPGIAALCAHLVKYAAREPNYCERVDYDRARGWNFGVQLLTNILGALAKIEQGGSLPSGEKLV